MRKSFLLLFTFFLACGAFTQQPFRQSTAYIEVGGAAPVIAVEYERQFKKEPGLGAYIGIGLGGELPAIPFGLKYLFPIKKSEKSFIEAGVGISLMEKDGWEDKLVNDNSNDYIGTFIPSLGYRHHTPYGLMWRINYSPVFTKYRNVLWLCGLSVGWRF